MDNASYIALSRMIAQQHLLDARAMNVANANTPGYKAENVLFSDYLIRQPGNATVPGGQVQQMVQDRATWRDFSEGSLMRTGNPLDLALDGEGFFVIDTQQGPRYTRAGRFTLSPSRQIVDAQGNTVQDVNGRPITIPQSDGRITVSSDGTVSTESGSLGKLRVVQFDNQQGLQPQGNSLFTSAQPPNDVAAPAIVQGGLEAANVQPIVELTRMMAEMRDFQFASQFVDGNSQREQAAIDRILRTS